jgi:hypothetical protein
VRATPHLFISVATIGAEMASMRHGGDRRSHQSTNSDFDPLHKISADKAAKIMGVGRLQATEPDPACSSALDLEPRLVPAVPCAPFLSHQLTSSCEEENGFDIKHQGITCTLTGCEWMPLAITTVS